MGKCYCDYCDVFLTNDSVAVRKQHNDGNRHKYNVCEYYKQYIGQQLQEQIDAIVESFERRVAQGLIIPSYGLPPVQKPAAQDVKTQADDKQQGSAEDEKETEGVPESAAGGEQTSAEDNDANKEDTLRNGKTVMETPKSDNAEPDPCQSVQPKQADNAKAIET